MIIKHLKILLSFRIKYLKEIQENSDTEFASMHKQKQRIVSNNALFD